MASPNITELQRLECVHWMIAPSILVHYGQRPDYSLAFASLYGQLAVDALFTDTEAAVSLIHKATRHAWIYIFSQEYPS